MVKMGAPIPSMVSMFETLQNLEVVIRTAFGDSARSYKRNGGIPDQGLAQGNGSGPQAFVALSSSMMDVMKKDGHGAQITAPISGDTSRTAVEIYVDDADQSKDAERPTDTRLAVAAGLQTSVDDWQGYLKATGGALVPWKSFWHWIDFDWKDGNWSYADTSETPFEFKMTDADGHRTTIDLVHHDEGRKTLGTFIAPSGSWNTAIEKIVEKVTSRLERAWKAPTERREMWLGMEMTLKKTIEYPLTAMYASTKEWEEVDKKIRKVYLPKSGFNRNIPTAILHGPTN